MADEVRPQDAWLQARFSEFYGRNPPSPPDRFTRREFGFLFFGQKFMLRHVGFPSQGELQEFLVRNGPAHAFYSTAYYQTPNARTMQEKGWMGAELIFDLDADHVPGAEKLPYREQLERVKTYFLRLVEDFIMRDFGFQERDLLLTFSGGRGYHCHVLREKALQLTSQERREIVDYVTGTGLDLGRFIHTDVVRRYKLADREVAVKTLRIDPANSAGWGSRFNEAVVRLVQDLKTKDDEGLKQELGEVYKFTRASFLTFKRDLERTTPEKIQNGLVDQGPVVLKVLERKFDPKTIIPLAKGETDEPVTSDTKRLIRLPGSLHGKSGLRVVTLKLDEVRRFDPLRDAVAFGGAPVQIRVEKPAKVDVGGFSKELPVGEIEVPEAAAVMLVARGAAVPIK